MTEEPPKPEAAVSGVQQSAVTNALRLIASQGVYALALKIIAMASTLVFVSLMGFLVSAPVYGALAGLMATITLAAAFGSFGQQTFMMRNLVRLRQTEQTAATPSEITTAVSWVLQIGAVVGAGVALLIWLNGASVSFALCIFLLVVVCSLSMCLSGILRAQGKLLWAIGPREIFWRSGIMGICATLGLGLGMSLSPLQVAVVALLVLASMVVAQAVIAGIGRPRYVPLWVNPPDRRRASINLMIIDAAGQVMANLDVIVVAGLMSSVAAAEYYPASRLALVLGFPVVALQWVIATRLVPVLRDDATERVGLHEITTFATSLIIATNLIVVLMLYLGWDTYKGLFPTASSTTFACLVILGSAQFVQASLGFGDLALVMTGHDRIVRIIQLTSMVVAALLALALAQLQDQTAIALGAAGIVVVRKLVLTTLAYQTLGVLPLRLFYVWKASR